MSNIDFSKVVTAAARIEQDRAKALSDLADIRWQCAMAGVVLPGGLQVPGDEVTRVSLSGAVSALQQGMISEPLAWKTPTGFVELTQAQVEAAAQAVVQHIQACFAAEASVAAQIEAASDPAGFDIQAAFGAALAA
ncbi:DUF4376 domain-containing protein [Tritonibacter scottomollicae]|uniref:Uncharacterized protein DUF4376 n=1 Tax=Tritonibacter scottomollicae TaxID=483013 RepID=A0A2T1AIC9_TRISK|nr:DUF4376 domain-containing protein [Tritonibacter scottomollicae]PRZ48359.1 uncharacterized protein DUF4376 [Tritonibacter scottomollicae]